MITKVDSSNWEKYKALFEDAENLLSGYKEVKTFDKKIIEKGYFYYHRVARGNFEKIVTEENTSAIKSLADFARYLNEYKELYIALVDKQGNIIDTETQYGYVASNGITTLEEYFAWLGTIKDIDDDYVNRYIELPLDEPHFTIDANTRAITIPTEFRKNGISVQGDNLAEVVYFEIDRFYDYMDFNNCEIYIQWEAPKAGKASVSKVISKAIYYDTKNDTNKLVFGWPISDALTGESGNLKFSVQFYQLGEEGSDEANTVVYSFNTLTATAAIKAGFKIDLNAEDLHVDDVGSRIKDRISNSTIAGGYVAKTPVWIIDLVEDEYDLEDNQELCVEASAQDTGAITYKWFKVELVNDNEEDESQKRQLTKDDGVENKYTGISFEKAESVNQTYYAYKEGYGYVELSTLGTSITAPNLKEVLAEKGYDDTQVFIFVSSYTPKDAGVYYAEAESRITNSSASTKSKRVRYPLPVQLKLDDVEFTQSNHGILPADNSGVTFEVNIKNQNEKEKNSYKWFKCEDSSIDYSESGAIWAEISEETSNTYTATEKGRYKVQIANSRNTREKYFNTAALRVTGQAKPVTWSINGDRIFTLNALKENGFEITIAEGTEFDSFDVAWYVFENEVATEIYKEEKQTVLTYRFNPLDFEDAIHKATGDEDNIFALYYPIITTNLNENAAETEVPARENMFDVREDNSIAPLSLDDEEPVSRVTLDDSKLFFEN